jgi:site-specific recombinase XerD
MDYEDLAQRSSLDRAIIVRLRGDADSPGLPVAWADLWESYEIVKRPALSQLTLDNYRDTLTQFARFLGPEPPPLEAITRREIAAFVDDVKERTSRATAAMRYRGLSAVFGWLASPGEDEEPYIPQNPMKILRSPKVEDDPVPVLSFEEVRSLLAATRGPKFEDRRDEAMIRMLFDSGCRRGELASMRLEPSWLNLRDGGAMVSGKTGPRIVAFGAKTAAAMQRYIRVRARHPSHEEPWLWLGRKGRLLGNGIYQALAVRFEQAGIEAPKKAHIFRHSFSHHFRMEGGSEGDLTTLNGWTTPAMAFRYGRSAASARAREAHRRISPGDRL